MNRQRSRADHVCTTCRPGERQVIDHENATITVPRGLRGPQTSMHGGAAAGMVVCLGDRHLDDQTHRLSVRLHAPPPIETALPLDVKVEEGGHALAFAVTDPSGETPILTGTATTRQGSEGLPPVIEDEALQRLAMFASLNDEQQHRHDSFADIEDNPEFHGCFGCGPDNEVGLALRTRPVADGVSWTEWRPDPIWIDGDAVASLAAVAALDCTSAFPLKQFGLTRVDDTALLGSYSAELTRRPEAPLAESLRIVTSPGERDGRKIPAQIGLFTPEGESLITGLATWIVLAP